MGWMFLIGMVVGSFLMAAGVAIGRAFKGWEIVVENRNYNNCGMIEGDDDDGDTDLRFDPTRDSLFSDN